MLNLHQLTREIIAATPTADREVITAALFDAIPAGERDAALQMTLRGYVNSVLGAQNRDHMSTPEAVRAASVQVAPKGGRGRSWRRDAIFAHRADLRVNVATATGHKFLADCDRDDLLFAAARRRGTAAGLNAEARKFEAWAMALNEHDAETVGALPAEVIAKVLTAVAA